MAHMSKTSDGSERSIECDLRAVDGQHSRSTKLESMFDGVMSDEERKWFGVSKEYVIDEKEEGPVA